MSACYSECKGCGFSFYGYAHLGEPCSAECAEQIRAEADRG
jgi:hypothetical protein